MMWASMCCAPFTSAGISEMKGEPFFLFVLSGHFFSLLVFCFTSTHWIVNRRRACVVLGMWFLLLGESQHQQGQETCEAVALGTLMRALGSAGWTGG